MDHRWVAVFIDRERPPPTARLNRLMGGPTRSTGGDR
jgi:hypothetical protein